MSAGTHAEHGDAQKRQAQYNAALTGGAKGAAMGLSVALPTAYILHQRWLPFRHLTLPLKAFFVTSGTIAAGVIAADKAGISYEREHYSDAGAEKIKQYRSKEDQEWAELGTGDKALTWAKDNKFSVVAGRLLVASMGGIFAYIHNQPMSFAQKLVQTRVWAQGLTVASLVGMAAITQIPSAGDKILKEREDATDHSWKDFIGDANVDPAQSAKKASSKNNNGNGNERGKSGGGSSSSSGGGGGAQGRGGSSADEDAHGQGNTPIAGGGGSSSKSSSQKLHEEKGLGGEGQSTESEGRQLKESDSQRPKVIGADSSIKQSQPSQQSPDTPDKADRSASPFAKGEKAQPTKAGAGKTGSKGGYNGSN